MRPLRHVPGGVEIVTLLGETMVAVEYVPADAPRLRGLPALPPGARYRVRRGLGWIVISAVDELPAPAPRVAWRPVERRAVAAVAVAIAAHVGVAAALLLLGGGAGQEAGSGAPVAEVAAADPPVLAHVMKQPQEEQEWTCVPGVPSLLRGEAPLPEAPSTAARRDEGRRRAGAQARIASPPLRTRVGDGGCDGPGGGAAAPSGPGPGADGFGSLAALGAPLEPVNLTAPPDDDHGLLGEGFGYGMVGTGPGGSGTGWGTIGTGRYGAIGLQHDRPVRVTLVPGGRPPCPRRASTSPPRAAVAKVVRPLVRLLPVGDAAQDLLRDARRAMPELRACYQRALDADRRPAATATLSFVVSPGGSPQGVAITGTGDAELERCISSAVQTLRFPRAELTTARYQLLLAPTGE